MLTAKLRNVSIFLGLVTLGVSSATATLLDRGSDLVYDDVLNITWTRTAGLGNYGPTWDEARSRVAALVIDGVSGWRLPYASVSAGTGSPGSLVINCYTATELKCRDNEMHYMYYYNLGGRLFDNKTGVQTAIGGEVLNIKFSGYWSATTADHYPNHAWFFDFGSGGFNAADKSEQYWMSAWAVHDGDVANIPEPLSFSMLLPGLLIIHLATRGGSIKFTKA